MVDEEFGVDYLLVVLDGGVSLEEVDLGTEAAVEHVVVELSYSDSTY